MGRRDRRVADSRDKMASRDMWERAYAGQMNGRSGLPFWGQSGGKVKTACLRVMLQALTAGVLQDL